MASADYDMIVIRARASASSAPPRGRTIGLVAAGGPVIEPFPPADRRCATLGLPDTGQFAEDAQDHASTGNLAANFQSISAFPRIMKML